MIRVAVLTFGVAIAVTAGPGEARACATCQCGDPTLSVMGAAKPFDGRLRVSADALHRTDAIGEPDVSSLELQEQRLELGVSYALREWLVLSARLPLVRIDVEHYNLARDTVLHVADLELRGKVYVWQDRNWSPRHLVGITAGVELPTGPHIDAPAGAMVDRLETQPGSGSFDFLGGASYAYFRHPYSLYASATAYVATRGYDDTRAGPSLRTTVAGQYQPGTAIAYRFGIDARFDGRTREADDMEPDTGGFIAFASPEIVYQVETDLLLRAAVRIPIYNALYGFHDEGPIVSAGVTYDL